MVKSIDTLVVDIEKVLTEGAVVEDSKYEELGKQLAQTMKKALSERQREPTLRMSNIGRPCERALWYELNEVEGEPLRAETHMKFLTGHLLEDVLLFLAEAAGHTVEGRQSEQEIEGIKGHRDCIIDGHLVDAKSASSYSFKKFQSGGLRDDDAFGYIPQLQSYLHASQKDELLRDKENASFLVVDKAMGHICLDTHRKDSSINWEDFYNKKKQVATSETPPERAFSPEPMGASGNEKLPVNCSYCPFWKTCYPDTRVFLYSYGPVKLSKVTLEPKVPELKG